MLFGPYQERDKKEIELKEISAIDFNNFLLLIHGASEVEDDSVVGLLQLSHMWLASAVLKRCSKFLMYRSKMRMKIRFELADQYGFEDVKKSLIGQISNPSELSQLIPNDIKVIDPTCMALILEKSLNFHRIPTGTKDTDSQTMEEQLFSFEDDDKDLHDIVLIVEGKKFYCSKTNLAKHSAILKSLLFNQERDKKEIELKEISAIDFNNFLLLIHGASEVDDDNVEGLLQLSKMWHASAVLKRCSEFLMNNSDKSGKDRLELAAQYGFEEVKKSIISKISSLSELRELIPDDITTFDPTSMALILEKSLEFHGITPGKEGTMGRREDGTHFIYRWTQKSGSYDPEDW